MSFKKLPGSKISFEVNITEKNFSASQLKIIAKHKAGITISGFRKGHAPDEMIISRIGTQALFAESLQDSCGQSIQNFLTKEKVHIISPPTVDWPKANSDFPMTIKVECEIMPEVILGDYKKIKIKHEKLKITDTEIEATIAELMQQSMLGKEVIGACKKGQVVKIDFVAYDKNGKIIPGTKGENQTVRLGKGYFLPDLEAGIIGMKPNEEKKITVLFPRNYHASELAGTKQIFEVKLKNIIDIDPKKITDQHVKTITQGSVTTVKEFYEKVRKNTTLQKQQELNNTYVDAYKDELIKKSTIEIPASWTKQDVEQQVENLKKRPEYTKNPEEFWKMVGYDEAQFRKNMTTQSEKNNKSFLLLNEIIKKENIDLDDTDKQQLEHMKQSRRSEEQAIAELKINKFIKTITPQ